MIESDIEIKKVKKIMYGILLFLVLLGLIYVHKNLEITKDELKTITGTLKGDPLFDSGAKGHRYMEIKLIEYNNRRFHTDGYSYYVLKKKLIKTEIQDGSKVQLSIRNEKAKNWVDKMNRNLYIYDIITLKDDAQEYISLSDYNAYRKNDFWLIYLFWLPFFGLYTFWILKLKRTCSG